MLWKELFAESSAGRLGWLGRTIVGLLVLAVMFPVLGTFYECWPDDSAEFIEMTTILGSLIGCFGLLIVTARAATLVTSEKERDCWVSLLSTPLSAADIVCAKLVGNLYAARWITLVQALVWLLAVVLRPSFVGIAALFAATWLLLAGYASCLGLTFSLLLRNSTRAMAAALATGVFFGGIYLVFTFPILAIMQVAGRSEAWELMMLCIPYLLAYPGVAWDGGTLLDSRLVAYLGGMLIYGVVSGALWAWCVAMFDERAGRMREQ